jgi:hypothetical protein
MTTGALFARRVMASRSNSIISFSHLLSGLIKNLKQGEASSVREQGAAIMDEFSLNVVHCLLQDCMVSSTSMREFLAQLIQAERPSTFALITKLPVHFRRSDIPSAHF